MKENQSNNTRQRKRDMKGDHTPHCTCTSRRATAPTNPVGVDWRGQLSRRPLRGINELRVSCRRVSEEPDSEPPARYSCAAPGRSAFRFQAITSTTLPGNISPPEPTLIQAAKSRRLCTFYYADWNVASDRTLALQECLAQ
jgi:hypothetical protein